MTGHIRLAPERSDIALTKDEAIDTARDAFGDSRTAHARAQSRFGELTLLLYSDQMVTYQRLTAMRYATRTVIEQTLAIEAALTRSIEAIEATRKAEP